jgi:predicted nucleic acid-binding protein
LTIYCDTSLLVAILAQEPASERIFQWLEGCPPGTLFISDWTITEFSSAIALKVRAGHLNSEERANVLAAWAIHRETSLTVLTISSDQFMTAAIYGERVDLGLRAGDALHLAVAAKHGCAIATLDKAQAKAAVELGIPVEAV